MFSFPKKTKNPSPSPIEKRFGFSWFGARRATRTCAWYMAQQPISIHALCEEGDGSLVSASNVTFRFLSTPSARRATYIKYSHSLGQADFYPRPLRGGRHERALNNHADNQFLSTPSARRATQGNTAALSVTTIFLSTPSARRATGTVANYSKTKAISIHALCEEGDKPRLSCPSATWNFYPRPLRGGRLQYSGTHRPSLRFLSTPSARRATQQISDYVDWLDISIHALCEEGDISSAERAADTSYFYPRPLRGGRPKTALHRGDNSSNFYPRPLRGGRPDTLKRAQWGQMISIHALCEEGDPQRATRYRVASYFYPRPLRGGRQQKQRQNLYFQTNYTTFCTNLEEP